MAVVQAREREGEREVRTDRKGRGVRQCSRWWSFSRKTREWGGRGRMEGTSRQLKRPNLNNTYKEAHTTETKPAPVSRPHKGSGLLACWVDLITCTE